VVIDADGEMVADSHSGFRRPPREVLGSNDELPIRFEGRSVGTALMSSEAAPGSSIEPSASSLVREVAALGGDVSKFVTTSVAQALKHRLRHEGK
jgi:hypothetical protein